LSKSKIFFIFTSFSGLFSVLVWENILNGVVDGLISSSTFVSTYIRDVVGWGVYWCNLNYVKLKLMVSSSWWFRFNCIDPRSYLKQGIKGGRILYQMITIALDIFYYLFNLCVTTHLCKVDSFRMLAFCLSVYSPFYSESLLLILSCSHVGKFDKGWCKTTISADIKVTSVWQFRFLQRSQDWWSYWTFAWTDYFGH